MLPLGNAVLASKAPEPDRQDFVLGAAFGSLHRIAYTDWGPRENTTPVLCLPGLTRQGRDFDFLAAELARRGSRVICPDLPGRGRSGPFLTAFQYVFPQHCADATTVVWATGAQTIDWVGTSLGGLIGMVLAGTPGNRIRRLVVNDIGPVVPANAEARIGDKIDLMPSRFATFAEASTFYRRAFAEYGQLDNTFWDHIVRHSIAWSDQDRAFKVLLDRNIITAFHLYRYYGMPLWPSWRNIQVPVLILAGEKSDFLPPSLAEEMVRQNPRARVVTIPGVGHTPMLMQKDQIETVVKFLLEP
jgi:pimeloyl-ACP methyl ester carboxylesterase